MKRRFLYLLILSFLISALALDLGHIKSRVLAVTSGWAISGDNVYFNDGNVGIGTASPSAWLQMTDKVSQASLLAEVTNATSGFSELTGLQDVYIDDDIAYLIAVNSDPALTIVDISDPTNPQMLSEVVSVYNNDFADMSNPFSVIAKDGYVFVTSISAGNSLVIVDATDPENPTLASSIYDGDGEFSKLDSASGLDIQGDYAYITSGSENAFTIVDISDTSDPDLMSETSHASRLTGASRIVVSGNYAYIATYNEEISIYNVSNKSAPSYVGKLSSGTYTLMNGLSDMYIYNDMLFVSAYLDDAITIFDITSPGSPSLLAEVYDGDGTFSRLDGANGIFVQDNYAYVTSQYDDSFTIMDISNPSSPTLVMEVYDGDGTYSGLDQSFKVGVQDNYAYLVSHADSTFTVIGDVADKEIFNVSESGKVGIGTITPQATLDVAGFMKLQVNSGAPATCDSDTHGSIALNSASRLCTCKSGTGWVYTSDGSTSCSW